MCGERAKIVLGEKDSVLVKLDIFKLKDQWEELWEIKLMEFDLRWKGKEGRRRAKRISEETEWKRSLHWIMTINWFH